MSTTPSAAAEQRDNQITRSLRKFVEGLTDPTVLVSAENLSVLYANAEARVRYASFGLTDQTTLPEFVSRAFPEARRGDVEQAFSDLAGQTDPEPATVFLNDGMKQTHLRITSLDFDDDCQCGGVKSLYGVTITDPDFDAIMRRLEFVLDSTTDGIFIVNRTNHIVYFNRACEKLTGWRRDQAVMQTYECSNVLQCHNDDGESMGAESLCPAKVFFHKDTMPKPNEMLITTTSGKERYVETNYSPIKNPAGEVEFIVGIIRDIDERKRLEDQLVQNRNLVMLGSLVSGIAHEIKNPLGILMSSVEIVLNEKRPEDQRREAASYIKDEVRRLDERMKYFLAFAKPKPLMREPVDVGTLLRKVANHYQGATHNLNFHVQPPMCSHLPTTMADPDLLHQVFLNLIINAENACPNGGVLSITTDLNDEYIRVRFVDNGQGLDEENIMKMFDPFFTTKPDGTGLGLSIVHQIITSHRGKITARGNDGKPGLTVEILLPVTEENK
jgi:two-component system sensor histidine kinase AtoS